MPIEFVTKFFVMHIIRSHEYEADSYAVSFNHGAALNRALIQIFKKNKAPQKK